MSSTANSPQSTDLLTRTQQVLRAHDSRSMAGSLGRFLFGILGCLFAGAIFATVACLIGYISGIGNSISWLGWLGIAAVIILVLIWQQIRNAPGYHLESLSDHLEPNPSSRLEYEMGRARAGLAIIADLVMWGPRGVVEGFAGLRSRPTAKRDAVFARAAQMLLDLAHHGSGVEVRELMHPPEDMPVFTQAIDWLDAHDYIGKSSDGARLWIATMGKKRLSDHGIRAMLLKH